MTHNMTHSATTLEQYYQGIEVQGNQRTPEHAVRVSDAVLRTLGFNLSGGVKRKLVDSLPEELGRKLKRGWRLIHFRNRNITLQQFSKDVGLHTGNTDPQFAETITRAVFHNLKMLIDDDLNREIAKDLGPELRRAWNTA
ncbi:MAG: DUF2267 domain-containing protein [Chloroflexota bacterium]|jgi:uncharacterized protein (DUF2267 family)